MAEPARVVDLAGDEELPAWATVLELDREGVSAQWTLIGGLMVYAHARLGGIDSPRPTFDADFLVDFALDRSSLANARAVLNRLGFELDTRTAAAYRFRHSDHRAVDIMVADHLPKHLGKPRLDRRDAFEAPAGEQAIRRRELWELRFAPDLSCTVGVPNGLGALVAKGAAWLVDRRDRGRHLQDGAVLLAAVADPSAIDYDSMSGNDRKRLRALRDELVTPAHEAWSMLSGDERRRGLQNLELIARAAGP